jgi:hypothetical protein
MKCKYCGRNFNAKNAIFCSKNCDTYYSTEIKRKNNPELTRITVGVDQDLLKDLRIIQSNLIKNTSENISLSLVVNLLLEEGVKIKKIVMKNT